VQTQQEEKTQPIDRNIL